MGQPYSQSQCASFSYSYHSSITDPSRSPPQLSFRYFLLFKVAWLKALQTLTQMLWWRGTAVLPTTEADERMITHLSSRALLNSGHCITKRLGLLVSHRLLGKTIFHDASVPTQAGLFTGWICSYSSSRQQMLTFTALVLIIWKRQSGVLCDLTHSSVGDDGKQLKVHAQIWHG